MKDSTQYHPGSWKNVPALFKAIETFLGVQINKWLYSAPWNLPTPKHFKQYVPVNVISSITFKMYKNMEIGTVNMQPGCSFHGFELLKQI